MTLVSENIKFLRKKEGYTQEQLAEKIGIKRSLLGAYEEGRADPRLNNLLALAEVLETSVDILISKEVWKLEPSEVRQLHPHRRGSDILAISIDDQGNEWIDLVPQKAAAGYPNAYSDPEYIKELPKFRLPTLPPNATYRAFEITGDSMLPLLPGTVIVGQYVENLSHIKNGKTYILVTKDEGIVYKRVFNYIADTGKLFLVSDNRQYPPYQIDAAEVLEVWGAKAYISMQFPDMAKEEGDVSVETLAPIILDMQKQIMSLKKQEE